MLAWPLASRDTGPCAVTFLVDGTAQGPVSLDASGHASITTSSLAQGPHSISATFGANTNFNGSSSPGLSQTVLFSTAITVTSSTNPSGFGQPVTFTANVSSPNAGAGTPGGTV